MSALGEKRTLGNLTVAAASPLSHQQNRDPDGYEDHSRNDQER
jgi:hypothetical protein